MRFFTELMMFYDFIVWGLNDFIWLKKKKRGFITGYSDPMGFQMGLHRFN